MTTAARPMFNPPGLVFREADHTYHLRGIVLPSVTGLCKPLMPDYGFADPSLGTMVHELTMWADQGNPVVIPERALPYMEAWRDFRRDMKFTPDHIEVRVCNEYLGYAGTVDRIGVLHGRAAVLDIKTGEPEPWHGVQLAGYAMALGWMPDEGWRFGVYLSGDGRYRLRRYDDRSDFDAFKAALTLQNWRGRHGG